MVIGYSHFWEAAGDITLALAYTCIYICVPVHMVIGYCDVATVKAKNFALIWNITPEQVLRYDSGFAVPVLML